METMYGKTGDLDYLTKLKRKIINKLSGKVFELCYDYKKKRLKNSTELFDLVSLGEIYKIDAKQYDLVFDLIEVLTFIENIEFCNNELSKINNEKTTNNIL